MAIIYKQPTGVPIADKTDELLAQFATLLDRIEVEARNMDEVRKLVKQRHQIAKDLGFEVIYTGDYGGEIC